MEIIKNKLFEMQDMAYKDFQSALMPDIDKNSVIGVRIPDLRRFSKEIDEISALYFMNELPHAYYDENNLHAFLIERINVADRCFAELERFLPYVDNWATCDMMAPKSILKDESQLLKKAYEWIESEHTYTIRYGIGILLKHFLDEKFSVEYAQRVACISSNEYYVNMMCAWYFATALAKQYDAVIGCFERGILPVWVHNKSISKARDSFRISKETKSYLKTLKR